MKPAVFIGIVLIVLSILSFAYQGITYTTREKVLDIGPIEATAEKQKTIPLPPVFGRDGADWRHRSGDYRQQELVGSFPSARWR
jgi:hypothetical protein